MKLTKQLLNQLSKLGLASSIGMAALISFGSAPVLGQELTVGSEAPELDIEHWVNDGDGQFSHISEFESGKVYVVEFWATWCGPCISAMPHIASLQEKFADKDVQIISVSREDLETVEQFLEKPVRGQKNAKDDEALTYGELTSGYCLTVDPDRSVHTDYMKAARQTGIPCAFIVGKTGLVEWIGHPARIDQPLSDVVDGTWDRDTFAAEFKKSIEEKKEYEKVVKKIGPLVADLQFETAIEELDKFMEGLDPESVTMRRMVGIRNSIAMRAGGDLAIDTLNTLADSKQPTAVVPHVTGIIKRLRNDDDVHEDLIAAAITATEKAATFTSAKKVEDSRTVGMLMYYQANLLFHSGKLDEAIAMQEQSVENFDNRITQQFLEKLQDAKAEQEDSAEDDSEEDDSEEDDSEEDDSAEEDPTEEEENSEEADTE